MSGLLAALSWPHPAAAQEAGPNAGPDASPERLRQRTQELFQVQVREHWALHRSAPDGPAKAARATAVHEGDSLALVALYRATGGPNWTHRDNWLEKPVSEWYGVVLSGARVLELRLNANGLTGSIPAEIGNLAGLHFFDLSFNQLTGSIPAEIGNLSSLEWLYLGGNQLGGAIPPEIGGIRLLKHLFLHDNRLTGPIPAEIGNLTSLLAIGLWSNQLTGSIPHRIGNLGSLESFAASENQLSGAIPPEIGRLSRLEHLGLSGNRLSGALPPEIGNLARMRELWASRNQLSGAIPPEIGNLANLNDLSLWDNQLTGTIPREIGMLSALDSLSLSNNELTGAIPPEIGNLANLKHLNLWGNQLSGAIPPEIGNLANLEELWALENQLSGAIPREIGALSHLVDLRLDSNQLTGTIPPEVGDLTALKSLSLYGNQLTGAIPEALGKLSALVDLSLARNQFTGTIPPALGKLSNLRNMSVRFNQLTGELPPELGDLTHLQLLYLSGNSLTGPIPGAFARLTALEEFFLEGTTVCMPADEALKAWFAGIDSTDIAVPACASSPLAAPQTTYPEHGAVRVELNPTLRWQAVPSATAYHVQVATDSTFATLVAEVDTVSSTSFGLRGLQANTRHFWRVRGLEGVTPGAWSATAVFQTRAAALAAPRLTTPPDAAVDVAIRPTFTWDALVDATSYRLQVSESAGFESLVLDQQVAAPRYEATADLGYETRYYWRVQAATAADSSGWSAAWSFTTARQTSGVATEGVDTIPERWSLGQNYPNPFNPATTIGFDVPAAGYVRLVVLDVMGRMVAVLVDGVHTAGRHMATFEAGSLAAGIYVYQLHTPVGVLDRRMVLVK